MTRNKTFIPNPNKMSEKELNFIQSVDSSESVTTNLKIQSPLSPPLDKFKGRMISMSDSFYATLNDYLKKNPTEGSRSSFIVRVVAEYIKAKNIMQ